MTPPWVASCSRIPSCPSRGIRRRWTGMRMFTTTRCATRIPAGGGWKRSGMWPTSCGMCGRCGGIPGTRGTGRRW